MGDRSNLTTGEESFALAYVAGSDGMQGNGTLSYLHAFPRCSSKHTASVSGSRLLKRDRVQARLRELRSEAAASVRALLRSWWDLAPEAQTTLERAAAGELPASWSDERIRSAVKSAQYIIDRCEGRPELRGSVQHTGGFAVLVAGPASLHGTTAGEVIDLAGSMAGELAQGDTAGAAHDLPARIQIGEQPPASGRVLEAGPD